MPRDPQSHLSPDELAGLAQETESVWQAAGADSDRKQAKTHAEACGVCGPRLRNQRSVQARLRSMVSTVASERKADCPPEEKWTSVASGVASAAEGKPLVEHASRCDYCGRLLREAAEDLNPKISAEEEEYVRQLPSASPRWQKNLAGKLAELAGEKRSDAPDHEGRRDFEAVVSPPSTRPWWRFENWTWWAAPVTAAAVIAVGATILIERNTPSLTSTNQLIAKAYTEQRPFEFRLPGAGYGPVRQERGDKGPGHSRMDEPAELLEAEAQIARGLANHPQDAGWLQAKARADLFEGHYQPAIEALQQAEAIRPDEASIKIDLAAAYFERGRSKRDPAEQSTDYDLALQTLNSALSTNPNNLVALFNRGMLFQEQKKNSEAIVDLKHYLQLDPEGRWAEEATRQLRESAR